MPYFRPTEKDTGKVQTTDHGLTLATMRSGHVSVHHAPIEPKSESIGGDHAVALPGSVPVVLESAQGFPTVPALAIGHAPSRTQQPLSVTATDRVVIEELPDPTVRPDIVVIDRGPVPTKGLEPQILPRKIVFRHGSAAEKLARKNLPLAIKKAGG
jgi:hypothetical protein